MNLPIEGYEPPTVRLIVKRLVRPINLKSLKARKPRA
jgi:hypothetical protein